jgi:F-type H+-transporting ATPase subunit epsilon
MATMQVQLVAPDRMVWSGEADIVLARTVQGELGILPRHAPLLGVLVEWPVTIRRSQEDALVAAVHGGFLSVDDEGVKVLAEIVELADEIDVARAREAWERTKDSDDEAEQAAARRARARLRAAGEDV